MTQGRWPERSIGPKGNPDGKYVGDLRDPANGEKVPRCAICGIPGGIPFEGRRAGVPGSLRVCDPCWFRWNPPDPLQVAA